MKQTAIILIFAVVGIRIYFIIKEYLQKKNDTQKKSDLCAQVICGGNNSVSRIKYNYDSTPDCREASKLHGGPKLCSFGCVGMGTCASVCPMHAIHIIDGIAAVDRSKCVGCGACLNVCPKGIIRLVPRSNTCWVGCSNTASREYTEAVCKIGCTGCGECVSACPSGAISIKDGVAVTDNKLCEGCCKCIEVCPRKTIWKA